MAGFCDHAALTRIAELIDYGTLRVIVSETLPMREGARALALSRNTRKKDILRAGDAATSLERKRTLCLLRTETSDNKVRGFPHSKSGASLPGRFVPKPGQVLRGIADPLAARWEHCATFQRAPTASGISGKFCGVFPDGSNRSE